MRALRVTVLPAAVALGLFAESAALERAPLAVGNSTADIALAVADLVAGLVFVGCGVVAWTRRPESRVGLLLTLSGIAWFLGTFAASGDAGYADFGALFLTLHRGPLVHALLSYPSGRLERWAERATVTFAYVLSFMAEVGLTPGATIALATAVLGVSAQRFLRAAGPLRRARGTAAAASAAFAIVLLVSGVTGLAGSAASVDRSVLWAYEVVLAGIALALTVDLVRGRWVEATVTGLVIDLGEAAETGGLRDHLANALGDRSLILGYRLEDRAVYIDELGRELDLPREEGDRRVTIVRNGGEPVAALVHDAGVLADQELVDSIAAAARLAVSNARLQAGIRSQVAELDASRRRVVEAADAERRRLERQLREGAERRLAELEAILGEAQHHASNGLAATLAPAQAKLARARSDLREFARGVHPRILSEGGLPAALGELADRSSVPTEVSVPGVRFPAPVEVTAYFVCSEALANVAKYAAASSAAIDVTERGGSIVVSVRDDGRGGARVDAGSGLRGLVDRVEALGGRLTVTSPPGEGTRLVAELPITEASSPS
jgi:signal transduction histidine kinase